MRYINLHLHYITFYITLHLHYITLHYITFTLHYITLHYITLHYLKLHQCLPLPHKRSPDGASPDWGCKHLIAAYYLFIYPERMKAESAWLAGLQRTVYPHKWSPVCCRWSAGQGKFASQRPAFYQLCHSATQPITWFAGCSPHIPSDLSIF